MKYLMILIYLTFSISGLILMKKGGNPGKININKKSFNLSFSTVSLLGLICYLCSFLIFTKIVVIFDLSYIMPIVTGIVQVATLIVANKLFNEKISKRSMFGACLVIIGIIVMNLKIG